MIVWKRMVNEGYNNAFLINENGKQIFERPADFMDYQINPHIRNIRIEVGKNGFPDVMNYWGVNGTFIVNEKAKSVLEKNFSNQKIQFFHCHCSQYPEMNFWILNAYNYQDLLDVKKSKYDTLINLKGEEVIRSVDKYVFTKEVYEHDIFKLFISGQKRETHLFLSDRFKQVMQENGVTGLAYKKVYESI